ncbi:MAG: hypothetical protein EA377_01200 [Phycisphaerales bacterium]|nr:MAG: hypothetical protein EA377_01200 [Phycisphaerales bacterium]
MKTPTAIGLLVLSLVILSVASCAQDENPPAPGFNEEDSDARAIELADAVMRAMGGRDAWDQTRYLTWNFFGVRRHVWDKHTGDLRVDWADRETGAAYVVLMNLDSGEGSVYEDGREITDEEVIQARLDFARTAWINDSYWIFMPYKLKDTGVTLTHIGTRDTAAGESAEVVQLTFEGVGETPENKYHVYIDPDSKLVVQWDFFARYDDQSPALSTPWTNWEQYARIMLSDDRGNGRRHSEVAVADEIDRSVFADPAPIEIAELFGPQR